VQDLLEFFVQKGEKEFFTVCLYTCYDLLRPDTVMELSWRAGLMEFAMPFFIQVTSELTNRVETVQKKHEDREKKVASPCHFFRKKPTPRNSRARLLISHRISTTWCLNS
jgi:clathrin heavy chain